MRADESAPNSTANLHRGNGLAKPPHFAAEVAKHTLMKRSQVITIGAVGIVDAAREALKEIPLSDGLRERVSLALDRLAEAEAKIEVLQTENGGVKSQLERERVEHQQTKEQMQLEALKEEVRIVADLEFRRGIRTGGAWKPFCPKCHLPLTIPQEPSYPAQCSDRKCGWESSLRSNEILVTQRQELPEN